jgi:hypothetical protein
MKLETGRKNILNLLTRCAVIIEESPVLTNIPVPNDSFETDEIEFSWVDEENGGCYTIPIENFDTATIEEDGLLVNDDKGDTCRIEFYEMSQVISSRKRYTISWQNQHDLNAMFEFSVPADVDVFQGYLEDYEAFVEGEECVEALILEKMGIAFEPSKGETLHIGESTTIHQAYTSDDLAL